MMYLSLLVSRARVRTEITAQAINQAIHLLMAACFRSSFRKEFPPL